jgi:hypothetical protein
MRGRYGASASTTCCTSGGILAEYSRHYNEHRPHQTREQRPLLHEPCQPVDITGWIRRTQVVRGVDQRVPQSGLTVQEHQLRATARVLAWHNAAPISARICASGRPVQWAIGRETGSAVFLVELIRPAWPIATKFHFGI